MDLLVDNDIVHVTSDEWREILRNIRVLTQGVPRSQKVPFLVQLCLAAEENIALKFMVMVYLSAMETKNPSRALRIRWSFDNLSEEV